MFLHLLYCALIGIVAGWLAGKLMKGSGFGLFGDLVVGVLGAVIGGFVADQLHLDLGGTLLSSLATATFGAVVLLFVIRLIRGNAK